MSWNISVAGSPAAISSALENNTSVPAGIKAAINEAIAAANGRILRINSSGHIGNGQGTGTFEVKALTLLPEPTAAPAPTAAPTSAPTTTTGPAPAPTEAPAPEPTPAPVESDPV